MHAVSCAHALVVLCVGVARAVAKSSIARLLRASHRERINPALAGAHARRPASGERLSLLLRSKRSVRRLMVLRLRRWRLRLARVVDGFLNFHWLKPV